MYVATTPLNTEMLLAADDIGGGVGYSSLSLYFTLVLYLLTLPGLLSGDEVCQSLLPDLGSKAYLLTLFSPYAGIYYWNDAQRVDEVVIKMETSDDERITSIVTQGGEEDLERFSITLELAEHGKVYVRGIFEGDGAPASTSGRDAEETEEIS